MFSYIERKIAFRYLKSRRSEGFISVIAGFSFVGIALGVATLIVVMAVMNGFRVEITKKILGLGGHISIASYEKGIENFDNVAEGLYGIKGIIAVSPIVSGQAMATTKYATSGAMVKGIRLSDLLKRNMIANNIVDGNIQDFAEPNTIIIGRQFSANMGIGVGDGLTLLSPEGNASAIGTLPRMKKYKVVAIFNSGMYEYDSSILFMPLEDAQILFRYKDTVSNLEIFTTNPDNSNLVTANIYDKTGGIFRIDDWQTMNASLFNALKVERSVMFLILTLIVFIAAFNIISSLIMLVNDKGKDIAIMRTMGATRGMILRIFFLCGSSIGVIGTLLGLLLGVGFAENIEPIRAFLESLVGVRLFDPVVYFLSELPADLQTADVIKAVSVGIIFSFLATIYPAWKASKQNPAEALRYE